MLAWLIAFCLLAASSRLRGRRFYCALSLFLGSVAGSVEDSAALAVNLSFISVPNSISMLLFFLAWSQTLDWDKDNWTTRSWSKPSFRARFRLLLTPRYYTVDDRGPPLGISPLRKGFRLKKMYFSFFSAISRIRSKSSAGIAMPQQCLCLRSSFSKPKWGVLPKSLHQKICSRRTFAP